MTEAFKQWNYRDDLIGLDCTLEARHQFLTAFVKEVELKAMQAGRDYPFDFVKAYFDLVPDFGLESKP